MGSKRRLPPMAGGSASALSHSRPAPTSADLPTNNEFEARGALL
jgi:hypothetical protein